mgnify:CR=1 FL=1
MANCYLTRQRLCNKHGRVAKAHRKKVLKFSKKNIFLAALYQLDHCVQVYMTVLKCFLRALKFVRLCFCLSTPYCERLIINVACNSLQNRLPKFAYYLAIKNTTVIGKIGLL